MVKGQPPPGGSSQAESATRGLDAGPPASSQHSHPTRCAPIARLWPAPRWQGQPPPGGSSQAENTIRGLDADALIPHTALSTPRTGR